MHHLFKENLIHLKEKNSFMAVRGRPPVFDSPEVMEDLIEQYFESIKGELISEEHDNGSTTQVYKGAEPVTITGLCLFLGFESRQSFYDYQNNPDFSYIVKRARMRVESAYEKKLNGNNVAGPVFALKNMGWADRQEIDQRIVVEQPIFNDDDLCKHE